MLGKKRTRKRRISKLTCSTKLYQDDHRTLTALVKDKASSESEVLRDIVSEWLRMKRVEALGKTQGEETVRKIYERILEEQLSPFTDQLRSIKASLHSLTNISQFQADSAKTSVAESSPASTEEILSRLNSLSEQIAETGAALSEIDVAQASRMKEIERALRAVQLIVTQGFASSWIIIELIGRYVVEANLPDQNISTQEIAEEVAQERNHFRQEGLQQVAELENLLSLPEKFRLAHLLLDNFSPPSEDE